MIKPGTQVPALDLLGQFHQRFLKHVLRGLLITSTIHEERLHARREMFKNLYKGLPISLLGDEPDLRGKIRRGGCRGCRLHYCSRRLLESHLSSLC